MDQGVMMVKSSIAWNYYGFDKGREDRQAILHRMVR